MSEIPTMTRPKQLYNTARHSQEYPYATRDILERAIIMKDGSVVLHPKFMEQGKFYLAVPDDKPYLYRKIDNGEIEVYGFA